VHGEFGPAAGAESIRARIAAFFRSSYALYAPAISVLPLRQHAQFGDLAVVVSAEIIPLCLEIAGGSPKCITVASGARRSQKRVSRSVHEDDFEHVKDEIKATAIALREGRFATNPTAKSCGRCDFRLMCSAGSKYMSAASIAK
jgi:PD-(D/E)XK nuclease superfamily